MLKIVSKATKTSKETDIADNATEESKTMQEALSSCPICKQDFAKYTTNEKQSHVELCVDSSAPQHPTKVPTSCFVCGRNLELYSIDQRQSHMNRCFDNAQKNVEQTNEKENIAQKNGYICMVCEKDLTNTNPSGRIKHLKLCLKLHNINKEEGKKLIEQWQQNGKDAKQQISGSKRSRNPSSIPETSSKRRKNEESDSSSTTIAPEKSMFNEFQFSVNNFKTISDGIANASIKTVHDWLVALGMQEYEKMFLDNGYDSLEVCSEMDTADFQDALQIGKVGHRKKLLLAASQLKKDLQKMSRIQSRNQLKAQMAKPIRSPLPKEYQHKIAQNGLHLLETSSSTSFTTPKRFNSSIQEVCNSNVADNSKMLEMLMENTPPRNVPSTQPIKESRFIKKSLLEEEVSFKKNSSGNLWKMSTTLNQTDCNVLGVAFAQSSNKEDSVLEEILDIDFSLTQQNISEEPKKIESIEEGKEETLHDENHDPEESKIDHEDNVVTQFESLLLNYRNKFLSLYDEFREQFDAIGGKSNTKFDLPSISHIVDADFLNCMLEVIEQTIKNPSTPSQHKEEEEEEIAEKQDLKTTVVEIDTSIHKELETACEIEITRKEVIPKVGNLEDSLLECQLLPPKDNTAVQNLNDEFVGYFTQSQHEEDGNTPMSPLLNQLSPLHAAQQEMVIDIPDESDEETVEPATTTTTTNQDNLPSPPLYFSDGEEERQQQELQERIHQKISQLSQNVVTEIETSTDTLSQATTSKNSKKKTTTSTQPTKQTTLTSSQPSTKATNTTGSSSQIETPNFYQMSALELKNLSKQYGLKPSNSKTVLITQLTKIYSQKSI